MPWHKKFMKVFLLYFIQCIPECCGTCFFSPSGSPGMRLDFHGFNIVLAWGVLFTTWGGGHFDLHGSCVYHCGCMEFACAVAWVFCWGVFEICLRGVLYSGCLRLAFWSASLSAFYLFGSWRWHDGPLSTMLAFLLILGFYALPMHQCVDIFIPFGCCGVVFCP